VLENNQIRRYCGDDYIQTYTFCRDEDPSNGCQDNKDKNVTDPWFDQMVFNAATTATQAVYADMVVLEERFCSANFTNSLTYPPVDGFK
jgi:hypothetical protein